MNSNRIEVLEQRQATIQKIDHNDKRIEELKKTLRAKGLKFVSLHNEMNTLNREILYTSAILGFFESKNKRQYEHLDKLNKNFT